MDMVAAIALLSVLGLPLGLLARWFVDRGHEDLGVLISGGDSDAWWQATLPWPRGVQEEDDVHWQWSDPGPAAVGSSAGRPVAPETLPDAFEIPPIRPQARVGLRQHRSTR